MGELQNPFASSFGTLESFVDRVSEVLQCHVTLEDAHHQLLAYSRHNEQTDSARIETIIRRRVPENVIYRLWKDGIIPQLLQSKEPVLVQESPDIGMRERVAISIWRDNEVLGFIWVQKINDGLQSNALKQLKQAASAATSLLIRHHKFLANRNEDTQELFWKMLTGHNTKDMQVHLPSTFTIIIFRFIDMPLEKLITKAAYFLKTSETIQIPFYTAEGEDLIVLAGHERTSQQSSLHIFQNFIMTFRKVVKEHLNVSDLDEAFGGLCDHHRDIARSFQEAKTVLNIHKKFPEETHDLLSYQELGIYQFLDMILEKRIQDGLGNHVIDKLMEYDHNNKTHLIATLETFLDENENAAQAAEKLHIHINTLSYRLKRIVEITELDLSKLNQKFMVYLDLKLLKAHDINKSS